MATIVGVALLEASVEVLVEKIVSGEFVNFFRSTKLDDELLEKLKITLLSLQAVIHDAEEKQITNPAVKNWLDLLRDAVFEADDLFDEINTEALRRKVEAEYESGTAKVMTKLSSPFKRFNKKINSKLQKLYERLECLRKQKLGLKEVDSISIWKVTPTTSVVSDESAIYGRDDDRMKLKEFLLSDNGNDGGSKIGVISIVGMGGLGKTTLAKLLYNDFEVKEKFEVRGWAHVSKDFDVITLTKALLVSVTTETIIDSDLNKLQVQLQQNLRNKKYLLVLDDIWDETYGDWNSLNDIFNVGEMGSKIIITTRDERVALPMQVCLYVHHLRSLEAEDCESLLARHAFVGSNYQQQSNLKEIGREIAKKCDGLPLAAVALGGLLSIKLSQDYWNDVLKSSIWELTEKMVQPALLLSYRYLPAPLKGCFAYCSIFPKNSVLEKKKIVLLWIAEGLVPQPKREKCWEKVAEEYFDELVSRSLIRQRSTNGNEVTFEMHDLINDLAMIVSSPYCFRLDEEKPHERVRHLSYNREIYDFYDKFDKLNGMKSLRTFLPLPLHNPLCDFYNMSGKLVCDLLPQMKQLHVLSLSNYKNITKLPNSIGNLIYLRYLNMSHTKIAMLPSEICNLYNLQTLLLSGCSSLTELPNDMGKLVNLRHLDIRGTGLMEMPRQISRLENLQTLSDFIISIQGFGLEIADLGKHPNLLVNLSISQLQNVSNPSHVFEANLEMKTKIDKLVLHWSIGYSSYSQIKSVVLERLRPSTNLKSLTINGFAGNNFPNWLGASSFTNMVCLRILQCKNCTGLPPIGQLGNLKELFIGGMESVKRVGIKFYGSGSPSFQSFPVLETLEFETMPEWEEWKLIGDVTTKFPCLTRLSLKRCPKLKGNIPLGQLGYLKELFIEGMETVKTIGTEFYGTSSSPLFQPIPSLEILSFNGMLEWEEWKLVGGTSTKFPNLTSLSLRNCPKLKGNIPDNLPSLTSLSLELCPKLKGMIPNNLPSLCELKLYECPLLVESRHSIIISRPSSNLFGQLVICFNSLRKMHLSNIPSLTSFPNDGLSKTLQSLKISNCENLNFLSDESLHSYKSLEDLVIYCSCNSMTLFALGSLPVLKSLCIGKCKNLKSILITEESSQQNLLFLRSIYIVSCNELESVSFGGLVIPNLTYLTFSLCKKLRSLPKSIKAQARLKEMFILDLPDLESFSIDDLPVSLYELSVGKVGGILWNTSWERLTSLSELRIWSYDLVKALMKAEVPLLPVSLVRLYIENLEDIECLDGKWLQHLTSLQILDIEYAPELKSLPGEGKLPSSLKQLSIGLCPLLEASLRRKQGKEWRKIAHIPTILIHDEMLT